MCGESVVYDEPADWIVEQAQQQSVTLSRRKLADWHRAGLIPKPDQEFLGGLDGSESIYPRGTLRHVSSIISTYNARRSDLLRPTGKYLELMNNFLYDSGKKIEFNDRGYMSVRIDGLNEEKSISYLSSGEAQIFVILTHLAFNPLAQNNVFIIDEPELSLHVRW
jgi:hypothetical protein